MSNVAPMAEKVAECSHTPGPWGIEMHGNWLFVAIPHAVGRKILARIETGFNEPFESQQHANARLIAAAPDLLEALKDLLHRSENEGWAYSADEREAAVAAIAKAEGRS